MAEVGGREGGKNHGDSGGKTPGKRSGKTSGKTAEKGPSEPDLENGPVVSFSGNQVALLEGFLKGSAGGVPSSSVSEDSGEDLSGQCSVLAARNFSGFEVGSLSQVV